MRMDSDYSSAPAVKAGITSQEHAPDSRRGVRKQVNQKSPLP